MTLLLKGFLSLWPMVLGGCIGSQFVVEDSNYQAPFPSLHDVPENPKQTAPSQHIALKEKLSSSQQENLDENKKLRKKYGL